jgi:hypothetical protein
MTVEIGLQVKCQDCKQTIEIKEYTISFYNKRGNLVVLCNNCCKINVFTPKKDLTQWIGEKNWIMKK